MDETSSHPSTIILLGPYLSGKSTSRRLLADALKMPQCSLNSFDSEGLWERYRREAGFDRSEVRRLLATGEPDALYHYMKPFEAYAVARCVTEHPGHVIELGATQSVYEDAHLLERVRQALVPYQYSILLLPSPDEEVSYGVLRKRYEAFMGTELIENFVRHHSSHDLATHTVYTEGKTPEETHDEILRLFTESGSRPTSIVLIGPPAVGKSTIAGLLSTSLGLPHRPLDMLRWGYYAEMGYDPELAGDIWEHLGFGGIYRYWKPFEAHAVERVLADYPDGIIDFGAGHSVYESDALFARVQRALASHEHVVLLLPSPDLDESVRILKERPRTTIAGIDANLYLLRHPSNRRLARMVVYTEGKTPEETRDEILAAIRSGEEPGCPSS